MKIEEYISSLPDSIISGQEVQLLDDSLREIFKFAGLGANDVFYHLGCGTGNSLQIAAKEFGARAVGIDNDPEKISQIKKDPKIIALHQDITDADLSDATIVLFWFSDEAIIAKMLEKFSNLRPGCKIITIFDPLPGVIPNKVRFPYLLHQTPFILAKSLKDQIMAVFETECIDFTTAWEHAERYTKAVGSPDTGNDRFLTILQTVMIWINAKNLGLACTQEIPAPVKAYIEILDNFFNIEVRHLIK
ncbi:class I SAM-dependent methyltransferase [Candidatus Nitrosotenuis aquarius]|uniref:class I SAM-dependent methyltransferase n=1 Tax=Candidatus Nitrosotenuis aquarius TaxID=1846278 RepID=UPI000C1E302E|nr:class I SAM-dependent methyltransferase [Candidatus Nitrosotenuis aquarius]